MSHNWPQMIQDLRTAGLTNWKIAQAIGYNHPKEVQAIESGRVPRHDTGEMLIALHRIYIRPVGPVSCETTTSSGSQSP